MTQYRKESCFSCLLTEVHSKHRELLRVKHLVKKDFAGVDLSGIQFSVKRERGFLKGVGFCHAPSPGICSGSQSSAFPCLSGTASRAPALLFPPCPQKALHILFYYKTHLHRVHIKIPFPAANCAVHRHLHLHDHISSFPFKKKKSLSFPRLAL